MTRTSLVFLVLAIVCEVAATLSLKATDGFKNLWPLVIVVGGYAGAFAFLGLTLREMSVGVAYASWSAAGTVLVTILAAVIFKQHLNGITIIGLAVTVAGIVIINLSATEVH